jgi:queuosine precursor transporter
MEQGARQWLFITLVGVFLTALLLGNLIAGKLIGVPIGGRELAMSAGGIPFPLTFVLTDLLNEFYGRKVVRRVTLLGFAMTALAFGMIYFADALAWHGSAEDGAYRTSWEMIFSSATRIQIASMIAYLIGQFLDISVFFALKRLTGGRALWLRATGSTVLSQGIDTALVTLIGFSFLPDEILVEMITTAYGLKIVVAIALTPVLYGLHALIERRMGLAPSAG